jgi:hypothetical protein
MYRMKRSPFLQASAEALALQRGTSCFTREVAGCLQHFLKIEVRYAHQLNRYTFFLRRTKAWHSC